MDHNRQVHSSTEREDAAERNPLAPPTGYRPSSDRAPFRRAPRRARMTTQLDNRLPIRFRRLAAIVGMNPHRGPDGIKALSQLDARSRRFDLSANRQNRSHISCRGFAEPMVEILAQAFVAQMRVGINDQRGAPKANDYGLIILIEAVGL